MSKQGIHGIRAAKGLLGLLDENSAEDFEAAEGVLGEQELVDILRLLAKYQKRVRPPKSAQEPVPKLYTVDELKQLVRAELLDLEIRPADMASIAKRILEPSTPFLTPPSAKLEDVVQRVLDWIDTHNESPRDQGHALVDLVRDAARLAGPEQETKVEDSLRALAAEALARNLIMFPDMKSLSYLRRKWYNKPLAALPRESRHSLASRLLNDAQVYAADAYKKILEDLLLDGLRSPTDTATTWLRRMDLHKANPPSAADTPASQEKLAVGKRYK